MAAALRNFYNRLTPSSSNVSLASTKETKETKEPGFTKAKQHDALFPKTDPVVDGEDCLHDCSSCSIKYPRSFSIDEEEPLYGHVNGWSTHLIVATGKSDWVHDVTDEKGSIMEAVEKSHIKPTNGVSIPARVCFTVSYACADPAPETEALGFQYACPYALGS